MTWQHCTSLRSQDVNYTQNVQSISLTNPSSPGAQGTESNMAETVQELVLGQLAVRMGKLIFILISPQSEMNLLWIIEQKTSKLKR